MHLQRIIQQSCSLFSIPAGLSGEKRVAHIAKQAFACLAIAMVLTLVAGLVTMPPAFLGLIVTGAVLSISICAYKALQGVALQLWINRKIVESARQPQKLDASILDRYGANRPK